jgi:hypothetical protein
MADQVLSPAASAHPVTRPPLDSAIDLRPLTTGELIDRSFSLYRAHFAGFLLLALLCQAAPLLNQILDTALKLNPSQSEVLAHPEQAFTKIGVMSGMLIVTQVIVFCFEIIITFFIADAYLGKNPSVVESMRKFTAIIPRSIWTSLLSMFLIGSTLIFPVMAMVGPYLYTLWHPPESWLPIILLIMASGVLFIVSLVPLLIVFMRLMLIIPALALEGLRGWKSIWRSSALVRFDPGLGILYWGEMRLSFLLLPLFIIELLIFSLTSLPVLIFKITEIIRHGGGGQLPMPPDSTLILSQVLSYLGISLILPLYPICTTLFYYDIRIRREGFDLEVIAQQLKATS